MVRRTPFYPFFIALYPVLALAAHNIAQLSISDIWRPLITSLLLVGMILGITYLAVRDWHRAALVASLILILFFSYGQIYDQIRGLGLGGISIFRHRTLGPLWALLLAGGAYWLGWKFKTPRATTGWLNTIALFMLVFPILTLNLAAIQRTSTSANVEQDVAQPTGQSTAHPDIYYIILDAYGREDVLYGEFHYDNKAFLDALRARGFYIAECSQSNYAQTELSLSSSLNMDYLDNLGTNYFALIKHSRIREFLEARGYLTAAFATGFHWTEIDDAGYYIQPIYGQGSLTEFEDLLISTTAFRIYRDRMVAETSTAQRYRDRTLSALANLKGLPEKDEPLFAFAHIISPHRPYVFDEKGLPVYFDQDHLTLEMESKGYTGQVSFINHKILDVIDTLLANSRIPPIIIIQGDHGPARVSHKERMWIFNAYYMPDAVKSLYPGISPVNTFRILLNTYFGQTYPLLADRSYYSTYADRTDFELIPNSCSETP